LTLCVLSPRCSTACAHTCALFKVVKNPPATYFVKKAAGAPHARSAAHLRDVTRCSPGISTGSQKPGHQKRGSISLKHVYEIAKACRPPGEHGISRRSLTLRRESR